MNVTAGIGAILLGWMDDLAGSKLTILISLICLTGIGIPVIFLHSKWPFWICSLLLSLFVGPTQSASRSLMTHLISKQKTATEMFGLYALSGRVTAFLGPWILGSTTLLFNSQRIGMTTVLIFFVASLVAGLSFYSKETPKKRKAFEGGVIDCTIFPTPPLPNPACEWRIQMRKQKSFLLAIYVFTMADFKQANGLLIRKPKNNPIISGYAEREKSGQRTG